LEYLDEIWGHLPEERPDIQPSVVDFALATVAMAVSRGAPARVLDLGCGDGRLAARLGEAGAHVTGLDASAAALARAREAHPDLALAGPAPDGALPFADGSFDAIVCIHVLQHVADTQLFLSEARRVLAPAGLLAVAVPWHGRFKNLLIALGPFERHHDPLEPVLRFYTARSLRRLLEEFAFEQVETRGVGGLPLLRETLLARARRSFLLPRRGGEIGR
jgi:ubiquinone/menaquinone biosynthesis C-methylase UbiE